MSAYVIAQITVLDWEGFEAYREAVAPSIRAFGGDYIVRGGEVEVVEGSHDGRRIVILEFPSREQARAWWTSPEYADVKRLREDNAILDVIAIDGV
jgi:uncharacterized protein (DUF1330 family)